MLSVRSTALVLLGSLLACWAGCAVHAAVAPPSEEVMINGKLESQNILQYAFVQMQFVEISKIDGVEQAFHADFFMVTSWVIDPTGTNFTVDSDLSAEDLHANFWSPSLEFINARSEITRLVDEPFFFSENPGFMPNDTRTIRVANLTLDPSGNTLVDFVVPQNWLWVQEDQRYQCDFTTPLKMQSFPFDEQFMQLQVESYWDSSQVQITWAQPEKIDALLPDSMPEIVGWDEMNSVYFATEIPYSYNSRNYNRLTIRTLLARQPDYYMTKIVAGSMLLVYMCTWIFSLGIDEADRMMGSLQVFGGLITYLFVASGDTPKVPYQTRLDVFMMFSFFCVACMLFMHGLLYYWRECDIEDHLEEVEKVYDEMLNNKAGGNGPSSPHIRGPVLPKWRVRVSLTKDFSLAKWWRGLHLTRKFDVVIIPSMMVIYSVGVAIIFGRAAEKPDMLTM